MNHYLETGGKRVDPRHFRLMINRAGICQTSANFMLSGSDSSNQVCAVCVGICEACADSCEEVGSMKTVLQPAANAPGVAVKYPAHADRT